MKVYFAAALFSGRETLFNLALVNRLERRGYEVNFPQRDGFEFGNLRKALLGRLPEKDVDPAVQSAIYLLDMGKFIPESETVIANLDEPIDEGVIVEISYSKLINKNVIGFRTDCRSPFGQNGYRGIHFFPAFQCDRFINHDMPNRTTDETTTYLDILAEKINAAVNELPRKKEEHQIPGFNRVKILADYLFGGMEDIHSEKGLEEIARRFIEKREDIRSLSPTVMF